MRYDRPQLRDSLAAQYALGSLRGLARRRFERLMQSDAGLEAAAAYWQSRLNGLVEALPPVEPPPHVWDAIERAIDPPIAPMIAATPAFADRTVVPLRGRMMTRPSRGIAFWRGAALAATAAAAMLAIYIGVRQPAATVAEPIAVLNDESGQAAFVVESGRDTRLLAVTQIAGAAAAPGKSYQLWLLPRGGAKPRPLGLMPQEGRVVLTLTSDDAGALPAAVGVAISLEPEGGSPTGLPTGPVLFKGPVVAPRRG